MGDYMKTIGVILRFCEEGRGSYSFPQELTTYLDGKKHILGIYVNFTRDPIVELERLKEVLEFCDGIIFPGDRFIYPIDLLLASYLYKTQKPTLGICCGMQIMAEAFGGIEQKMSTLNHRKDEVYVHSITIHPCSKLFQILKKETIFVNSRHQYEIKNTNLFVSATSSDGTIEAIEAPNLPFFIGVQWHPESIGDENSISLWKAFEEAIKNR